MSTHTPAQIAAYYRRTRKFYAPAAAAYTSVSSNIAQRAAAITAPDYTPIQIALVRMLDDCTAARAANAHLAITAAQRGDHHTAADARAHTAAAERAADTIAAAITADAPSITHAAQRAYTAAQRAQEHAAQITAIYAAQEHAAAYRDPTFTAPTPTPPPNAPSITPAAPSITAADLIDYAAQIAQYFTRTHTHTAQIAAHAIAAARAADLEHAAQIAHTAAHIAIADAQCSTYAAAAAAQIAITAAAHLHTARAAQRAQEHATKARTAADLGMGEVLHPSTRAQRAQRAQEHATNARTAADTAITAAQIARAAAADLDLLCTAAARAIADAGRITPAQEHAIAALHTAAQIAQRVRLWIAADANTAITAAANAHTHTRRAHAAADMIAA